MLTIRAVTLITTITTPYEKIKIKTRFFFSSTIILTLDIPDGQLGLPGVCADVGAFFGIVIATLILVKLKPQARVVLNGITQVSRKRYGTGAHTAM